MDGVGGMEGQFEGIAASERPQKTKRRRRAPTRVQEKTRRHGAPSTSVMRVNRAA